MRQSHRIGSLSGGGRFANPDDRMVLARLGVAFEQGSILIGLVSLAEFSIAVCKFAVNKVRRWLGVCGNLEHFSRLGESTFIAKDVTQVFSNITVVWRCDESLFEGFDSDIGRYLRVKEFVITTTINGNGANDFAVTFVMMIVNLVTAKEVGILADAFREASVDVAVGDRTVRMDVLRFNNEENVVSRFRQYACINWHNIPFRGLVGIRIQNDENVDIWIVDEGVNQSHHDHLE